MTERQNFLLSLYREFGDNAQKALDFVNRNDGIHVPETSSPAIATDSRANGVYILFDGNKLIPFDDGLDCTDALMIGIIQDGHSFGIPFDGNLGCFALLKSDDIPADDFCVCECQALLDWDFVRATNHIKELGTPIPLKDGQYLPTAPVWVAMYANKEQLNKALEKCGATPIDFTEDFWFAQRYLGNSAWFFYGYSGTLYDGYGHVYNAYQAQAVTLLPI